MVLKSFAPQVGWAFTIGLSLLLAFQMWLIWGLFSRDGRSGSDQCQGVGTCCWNSTRNQHQHLRRSQEQTSGFSVSLCCETETLTWLKSSLGWFSFLQGRSPVLLQAGQTRWSMLAPSVQGLHNLCDMRRPGTHSRSITCGSLLQPTELRCEWGVPRQVEA